MKRGFCAAFMLMFAACLALPVYAAQDEAPVRVAYFDMGNYYTVDAGGTADSYDSDVLEKLSTYCGLEFTYVDCGTWLNALDMLQANEVDLVGTVQWTPAREETYEFCLQNYGYTVASLATLADNPMVYEDYEAIGRAIVGCTDSYVRRAEMDAVFAAHGIAPVIKTYAGQRELENAFEAGEIDIISANSHTLHKDWNVVEKFYYAPIYFVSRKGNNALTDRIDDAIIRLHLRQPTVDDELLQKYFPDILGDPLSRAERDLIAKNNSYTIYFSISNKPMVWYDEATRNAKGAFVDACAQISKATGLSLNIRPAQEATANPEANEVQFAMLFYNSNEDISGEPGVTGPLIEEPFNLFYKVGHARSLTVSESTIAVVDTIGSMVDYAKERYPDSQIVGFPSTEECIKQLNSDKVDFAFLNTHGVDSVLTTHSIDDVRQFPADDTVLGFALMFTGENRDLLKSIVDKGIQKMDKSALSDCMVQYALDTAPEMNWKNFSARHPLWTAAGLAAMVAMLVIVAMLATYGITMRRQRDRVERADNDRSEFFARMSHDMRTPINGILGMIRLTEDIPALPAPARDNLKKAESAGVYMLSLINDTLDLQKLESKRMEFNPEIVYTKDYFENMFAMQRVAAQQKNIEFRVTNRNMEMNKYIEIDKIRVRQIFSNLLSNAIKFTPPGGVVEIVMECLGPDGDVSHKKFLVRDTGVGMSKTFIQKRLYQPYSQESNVLTSQKPGTGLGLAIVKNLLDAMGGRIEVESEPGEGTTFTFYMDFKNVSPEVAAAQEKLRAEVSNKVHYDLEGKRILLCEDHPLNAEIARRLLEKVGCEVTWAQNGQQGVQAVEQSAPQYFDAVLMDIRMPVMDGLTAARAIRALKRPDAKSLPIIAMTANAYDTDVQNSLDAGMNAHLAKPVEPDKMYRTIAKFCTRA